MGMNESRLPSPEELLLYKPHRSKSFVTSTYPVLSPLTSPVAFNEFPHRFLNVGLKQPHDNLLYPDHNQVVSTDQERPIFNTVPTFRWTPPERQHSPARHTASSSSQLAQHDSRVPFQPELKPIASPRLNHGPARAEIEPIGPVALNNHWGDDYYRLMMSQVEAHRDQRLAHRQLPSFKAPYARARDRYTSKQVSSLGRNNRVEKPESFAKPSLRRARGTAKATGPLPKPKSSTKRGRRRVPGLASSPALSANIKIEHQSQYSSAPKPHRRAAPTKKVVDTDDSDWAKIPDFSPPVHSLDSNKTLTVTWHNTNSLNLDNDPHRSDLHAQELEIASMLRLTCSQYLANKRRIFIAKVTALREGKDFIRTGAQSACPIDVKKASQLFVAFDGVGWFDECWFGKYICEKSPSTT